MTSLKVRPFLKWLGGKYRILDAIQDLLPQGDTLVEPFVGSGAVFLNTNYKKYILNDANPDLINLYQTIQQQGTEFINFAKESLRQNIITARNIINCGGSLIILWTMKKSSFIFVFKSPWL